MSYRKSKLDLLVRVRYQNPLPPPPCPPKLLEIPTNPSRYTKPEFLTSVASKKELPMIIDAELGMPLDLAAWGSLWDENVDDSLLNPSLENLPRLDPADELLMYDGAAGSSSSSTVTGGGGGGGGHVAPQVSWLRKTEYTSRSENQRASTHDSRQPTEEIDISRSAQLRDIAATFAACNEDFDLSALRHPTKPDVTAVESYEFLPDADIWANQYDLFRFSERPGERAVDEEDPRLDCAVLRPMKTEHDSFLAYYLMQDDESANRFKKDRASMAPYEVPSEDQETVFNFVRDYETTKVEQEVPNEFLLVFDDGDRERQKGAYYKNIERKMFLKKRRTQVTQGYEDKWELIRVRHTEMSAEEIEERDEALAEVTDVGFLLRALDADADADADIEVEDAGAIPTTNVSAADVFDEMDVDT